MPSSEAIRYEKEFNLTINVAIATYDAIVLGCDSLSSRTAQAVLPFSNGGFARDADGNELIDASGHKVVSTAELQMVVTDVFTGAKKMFLLYEDENCTVAGVTAGLAVLNGFTVAGTVGRFRRENRANKQSFDSVESVVAAFTQYIRADWEHAVGFNTADKEQAPYFPDLQFLIGGYSPSEEDGRVYKISILGHTVEQQFSWESKSGACFAGQADYVERLLVGVDSRVFHQFCISADAQLMDAQHRTAETILEQLRAAGIHIPEDLMLDLGGANFSPSYLGGAAPIDFANLPTQYAVELVELLVNLQSGMQRFQMGVATVGGRTHVGVIRRGEKFRMLNEPDLVHSHTGYNHDL